MEADFRKLLPTKSDKELQECIDNNFKYSQKDVFAAIGELKRRGRRFSNEQIEGIKLDFEVRRKIHQQRSGVLGLAFCGWDDNATEDKKAVELYSQKAIFFFAIFCGMLFAGVMLAMNLHRVAAKRAARKSGIAWVFIFIIVYKLLLVGIVFFFVWSRPFPLPVTRVVAYMFMLAAAVGGALVLSRFFWNKFIGEETIYRKRRVGGPVIIGLCVLLVTFAIYFSALYLLFQRIRMRRASPGRNRFAAVKYCLARQPHKALFVFSHGIQPQEDPAGDADVHVRAFVHQGHSGGHHTLP